MDSKIINEKLKELDKEDFIWLIYIGIIFMSWYSNVFERKYFIYNDLKAKEKYRNITIVIFIKLTKLAFIGSLLILISGFIFLYIALKDENIDVEIAFN